MTFLLGVHYERSEVESDKVTGKASPTRNERIMNEAILTMITVHLGKLILWQHAE